MLVYVYIYIYVTFDKSLLVFVLDVDPKMVKKIRITIQNVYAIYCSTNLYELFKDSNENT